MSPIETHANENDAIVVENLTKLYAAYRTPLEPLRYWLRGEPTPRFRALHDVSFRVKSGERVGVIGRNGAGKSTLLKIISQNVRATTGRVSVQGTVRGILELGTGFHDETSGRDNIIIGGLCLGYHTSELRERMDWIIEFAELEKFIDQPVRTFSSGMRARLMFAVAFCKPAEILIIDEALATGDSAFVQKCTNHIIDLCQHGSTALVVSHNLYFIERFCDRAIYLRNGELVDSGTASRIIKRYENDIGHDYVALDEAFGPDGVPEELVKEEAPSRLPRNGTGQILNDQGDWEEFDFSGAPPIRDKKLLELDSIEMLDASGKSIHSFDSGAPIRIRVSVSSRVQKEAVHVGVQVWSAGGVHLMTSTNESALGEDGQITRMQYDLVGGDLCFELYVPACRLGSGRYYLSFGVGPGWEHFSDDDMFVYQPRCLSFWVRRPGTTQKAFYEPVSEWKPLERIENGEP